jgi:hypothetical protein
LAASLIASVVAGGTMMAFVTAARISRQQSSPLASEANGFAQQTLEGIRNKVADDSTWLSSRAGLGWVDDPMGGAGGTESITTLSPKRCYRVTPEDCDGVGGTANDCYAVNVAVCWNDLASCPCP